MYEAAFRNIDNALRKDDGCATELDYTEQTSWILFLKYLNDFDIEREKSSELNNQNHSFILQEEYRWNVWAVPKKPDGTVDHNKGLTGDDLLDFVNTKLFPHLKSFKLSADNANTLEYKIGEIFSEIKNKFESGYILRDVLLSVDELEFLSSENQFELSSLYEDKIRNMGNSGRNGGEYYTPRPLIKSIIKVINPVIGETVYDGAVGSAGFLCEAYSHIKNSKELTVTEFEQLQSKTLYGKEKKSLAYVIGIMNMILHGVQSPNLVRSNTLNENIINIQDRDRHDVVLANPPFGGQTERSEVQNNFPIKTGETAYMFLQHFIKILKKGGRCGIVIKNTFLSNTDNASIALRKQLLEDCNLFAVLDLPGGAFLGAGVKTVVLFFERGKPTENIWYYQLDPGRKLGKTKPLDEKDLYEFLEFIKTKEESEKSWSVNLQDINKETWDLTVNNPNKFEEVDNRTPQEIIAEIEELDAEASKALQAIKELL